MRSKEEGRQPPQKKSRSVAKRMPTTEDDFEGKLKRKAKKKLSRFRRRPRVKTGQNRHGLSSSVGSND